MIFFSSCIHDHADSHCFMKVLSGKLKETQYEWPKNGEESTSLQTKDSIVYSTDNVAYINGT